MRAVGFEVIEHTADVGLLVRASGLDELFTDAARGLFSVMGRLDGDPDRDMSVELDAPDLGALLVDWLSELIYAFEAKGIVPLAYDVHVSTDPPRLTAGVRAGDASRFEQEGPAVKAATYHRLRVERAGDGWEAEVYLDI